jgi:hypothetical protein
MKLLIQNILSTLLHMFRKKHNITVKHREVISESHLGNIIHFTILSTDDMYIRDDRILQSHCCENLGSCLSFLQFKRLHYFSPWN